MTRSRASAKAAGTRTETAVVRYLREKLGTDLIERRAKSGRFDRGDLSGLRAHGQRIVVEVKDRATLEFGTWLNEAEVERLNDDALAGIVWAKRRATTDPGEFFVVMTGADLVALLTGRRPE